MSEQRRPPECVCPTDDYCPKCHPRWHAKWRTERAEQPCPRDHAGPCFDDPSLCRQILTDARAMTADHPTREERYAAVLEVHRADGWIVTSSEGYYVRCGCGENPTTDERDQVWPVWCAHVAAALVAADPAPAQPVPAPDHDHDKCCRPLLCSHPACCGYYGQPVPAPEVSRESLAPLYALAEAWEGWGGQVSQECAAILRRVLGDVAAPQASEVSRGVAEVCGVGGPREATSDCVLRYDHSGEHLDASGGSWPGPERPRSRDALGGERGDGA